MVGVDVAQLRAFMTVAELRHLGPASRRLGRSQSTLSRAISSLEEELERRLFLRDQSGFTLTAAGASLLPAAEQLLRLHQDMLDMVRTTGQSAGPPLRISCARSVPPRVLDLVLAELRPGRDVDLRFQAGARTSPELAEEVASGVLDLALVHLPVTAAGLRSELLLEYDHVVALRADHPLAGRASLMAADLTGQTVGLAWAGAHPAAAEPYRRRLEQADITVVTMPDDDIFRLAFAVRFGECLSIMRHPRYGGPAAMFEERGIRLVPTSDPVLRSHRLGMVWRPGAFPEENVRPILDRSASALRVL